MPPRDRVPPVALGRRAPRARGEALAGDAIGEQPGEGRPQRRRVAGGTSSAAPSAATSGKPPTALRTSGVPAPSAVNEHAGLVDLAVRQDGEVGAPEERRDLARRGRSARRSARRAAQPPAAAPCPSAACRRPTAPRPRCRARPRAGRRGPCTGAGGRRTARRAPRRRRARAAARRRREGCTRRAGSRSPCPAATPISLDQPRRGRARSGRRPRRRAGRAPAAPRAGPGAARAGRTSWAVRTSGRANARSRPASSGWTASHWKWTTSAPRAGAAAPREHVRHVAGELRRERGRAARRRAPR